MPETQNSAKKQKLASSMDDYKSSVYIPEPIICEILLRLGVKPLFRNKCVSKLWNSIISDPEFGLSYMNGTNKSPSCLSKLLLWGYFPRSIDSSTARSNGALDVPSLYLPDDHANVLASSGGLVLCGSYFPKPYNHFTGPLRLRNLCICNPLIKQSFSLPLIPNFSSPNKICLATRIEDNSPAYFSYKVVLIKEEKPQRSCAIAIYSSDTGRWSSDKIRVKNYPAIVLDSCPSTCSKGILHWFDFEAEILVTYDPYDSPERFGLVQLPINIESGVRVIQMGQEDAVKFGEIKDNGGGDRRLIVWRLYRDAEWAIEKTCIITPTWVYSPAVLDYFCCLGVEDEECVSRNDLINGVNPCSLEDNVPFALCPWACASKHKDGSQTTSFTKVSPVWFYPRNMYIALLDWFSDMDYRNLIYI